MTTVVISQPMYFPWPGFFELVATADVFVHLDDVQMADRGFTNRVQLKGAQGISWLTVPLKDRTQRKLIADLETAGDQWRAKHRRMIEHALARTPHLAEALHLLDAAHAKAGLLDLLIASIEGPARYLGCWKAREVVRSSALGISSTGSARILDLVRRLCGTRYVTAHGAANYLDHEAFERAGVAVEYIAYSKTPWRQRHGDFTPFVTVLDLIANEGPAAASAIHPATVPWREFLASRVE
ncbi:MAG: WbqC family protein [Pseudomonadota bacterium]